MESNDIWAWTKPRAFRSEYVLTCNDAPVATVAFGSFGCSVRVTGDGIDWTIKRSGILQQRVTVNDNATGASIATAHARFSGAYDVEVTGGFAARFKSISVWRAQFGWVRTDGTPMIIYSPASWCASLRKIEIRDTLAITDDVQLRALIILGGVLTAMTMNDTAAATAAIVAVAAVS